MLPASFRAMQTVGRHLTLSLPSLRPLLCYRLSHYDHCSSFLVLLGLPADKLSVMEMGRKGSEHCAPPPPGTEIEKNWIAVRIMIIGSFGLMIVWIVASVCSFSSLFPFFFFRNPLRQDASRILKTGSSGNIQTSRRAMTHHDLEEVQENIMNPFCRRSGRCLFVFVSESAVSLRLLKREIIFLPMDRRRVLGNRLCHWTIDTEEDPVSVDQCDGFTRCLSCEIDWCLSLGL